MRAIRHHLDLHNNRPFQNRLYSRRELFSTQEKNLLEALPVGAYEQREYWSGKINKDALVYFKGHYYSVPYRWRKKSFLYSSNQTSSRNFLVKKSSTTLYTPT